MISYAGRFGLAPALAVLAGFWTIGLVAMVIWSVAGIEARGLPLERLIKSPA
jgi:hypothetical protein